MLGLTRSTQIRFAYLRFACRYFSKAIGLSFSVLHSIKRVLYASARVYDASCYYSSSALRIIPRHACCKALYAIVFLGCMGVPLFGGAFLYFIAKKEQEKQAIASLVYYPLFRSIVFAMPITFLSSLIRTEAGPLIGKRHKYTLDPNRSSLRPYLALVRPLNIS